MMRDRRTPSLEPRSATALAPRRRWLAPLLLALGLLPATSVALRAAADEDGEGAGELSSATPEDARRRVLAALPVDPTVLINVTAREMPASPDILNLGKRSTAALARCLADNVDAGIRATCAMLLGRLGDRSALPTLQAALEDWEPQVRYEVIDALRLIPSPTSFEPLLKIYQRKDEQEENHLRAIAAFGALGDKRAVPVLRAALRAGGAEGPSRPTEAFRALWMSRHLMARETLVGDVADALRSTDDSALVLAATEASAELRSPRLVAPLIPLLESPVPGIRNKAVYALGLIGDKTATKALLARLPGVRDARMLNNIAFALERLDRDAFYSSIRKVIEHKQAVIRLNAAFVLGDVKRPEGVPMLEKALVDPSDYVKTSAIVALGKIGTEEAVKPLQAFVDAPNLTLREEAIYGIHARGGKAADLVYDKLFLSKNEAVRRRAAIELGKAGDPRVRSYLLGCLDFGSCSVADIVPSARLDKDPAVAGRLLLAWARGREDLTDLLAELRPPGTLPIALSDVDAALLRGDRSSAKAAMDLVGDLGDASAKPRLEGRLAEVDTWLRVHAAVALARLGDATADTTLLRDMDNLPAAWLPPFATALARIAEPDVRARLSPELQKREKGSDVDIALAAAAVHLAWDPEAAIFRLLDGLASASAKERELSERYLHRDRSTKVTWLLRRALARETRQDVRDRLRSVLDGRPEG